jgi:hypothetical protein
MPPKKEDEIKIPEAVLNRANRSIVDASYGITNQERERYKIPSFPSFGFATSTMLDQESEPPYIRPEERAVDYMRDAGLRMANRYTAPVSRLSGSFPTSRAGGYVNPEMSEYVENEKTYIRESPLGGAVGSAGFGREYTYGNKNVEQVVSPYGFAQTSLTPQQVEQREQARQQAQQMGTMPRTPEQQQALLAQMRQAGTAIRERIASDSMNFFGGRKPSQLYTTPSGAAIAAPTNMFGQPIKEFQDRYAQQEEKLRGSRSSSLATLGSTGFGAMQREQSSMVSPPVRNPSLFGGMGYASTLGGPQPASPMVATGPITSRNRRRIFGGT